LIAVDLMNLKGGSYSMLIDTGVQYNPTKPTVSVRNTLTYKHIFKSLFSGTLEQHALLILL